MTFLDYLKRARVHTASDEKGPPDVTISLVTNFTDDILRDVLAGVCLENGMSPLIYKTPYRQYHLELKNPASGLYAEKSDITFFFFDINPFKESEFHASKGHLEDVLHDIEQYARTTKGTVALNTFVVSYQTAYGNLFRESPHFKLVEACNEKLAELAARLPNGVLFDTNRLVHGIGESHVFDARGISAFDIPFTNEFMAALAEAWFACIRGQRGGAKKCIVLDLDNTLWGGVVGELGSRGIALGPDYPGSAFVNFQRALLDFYDRGVILAIASKNNLDDVLAAFRENSNMVLKEHHFSAIKANWDEKADSLIAIAKELNIGTDSMVFLDDDPVSRARVKLSLPEVSVPDFSLAPEEYVKALYALDLFDQYSLTDEDRQKGKMYAEERQRKEVQESARDIDAYIRELGIVARVSVNDRDLIPRLAQLTMKTNQFNLTTRRYAEHDIARLMDEGGFVFGSHVTDRFGDYGTVIEAIAVPMADKKNEAALDVFLMSCRVMGRGVECAFVDFVIRDLHARGIKKLHADFIPTSKNDPAKEFLADHGFTLETDHTTVAESGGKRYFLDIAHYIENPCSKLGKSVTILKTSSEARP